MSALREILGEVLGRTDERLLGHVYTAVSVSTPGVRRWLRRADKPFVDPDAAPASPSDVDRTADWVVVQSRFRATALGGLAGMAGAWSVPPEVLATLISSLRLGQRLAVVYGFDPETDRGQMALWRALAAGWEVDIPARGAIGLRVTELPGVVVGNGELSSAGGALAGAIVRRSAWSVGARFLRFLPVISSASAAVGARRRTAGMGQRMARLYRRLAEAPEVDPALLEDAVEIR